MRIRRFAPGSREAGQILVLAAGAFVAVLAASALVVDVGLVYATQRNERSATDAAALAGAQELQTTTEGRTITSGMRSLARARAMASITASLTGSASAPCGGPAYGSDVIRCPIPNTPYLVTITSPARRCVDCDINRSVQVGLTRVKLPTFFATVVGQDGWDVSQTSVAGLNFAGKFAVITLRPPKPDAAYAIDLNRRDVDLNGIGVLLKIVNGDLGTNTSMEAVTGVLQLDTDFVVWHYDEGWPWPYEDHLMPRTMLLKDPNYTYPAHGSTPVFTNQVDGEEDASTCKNRVNDVPATYVFSGVPINTMPAPGPGVAGGVHCYQPGVYVNGITNNSNSEVVLLDSYQPGSWVGTFFFDDPANKGGLNVSGGLIGGYKAGAPGVSLVFNTCTTSQCQFNGINAQMIVLNAGTRYGNAGGTEATAAIAPNGSRVRTASNSKPPNQPLTIMVQKDPTCVAVWDAAHNLYIQGANCDGNKTVKVAGGGSVYLAGVTYGPTDNIVFSGGSAGMGYVGQVVGWTVAYSGGTRIQQTYPMGPDTGVMRLDQACSGTDASSAACYPAS